MNNLKYPNHIGNNCPEISSIPISDLISMLEKNIPVPLRLSANLELKVLCPGPDDGDRGDIPTTTPLSVPETASLIISPLGCSLHLTETGRGHCNLGYTWFLRLEEHDIISSEHLNKIDAAVNHIVRNTPTPLKGLILCGTCIDVLLGSDYPFYSDYLSKKYDLRVTYQIMGPILKGTPKSGQYHMYTAVYHLLRSPDKCIPERTVNILGLMKNPSPDSELPLLLRKAGINHLYYIGDFSSLSECDKMTKSLLNIVTCENALTAAEDMEKNFHIPYLLMLPSYNPDTIHGYYKKLSELLNIAIDDRPYYEKIKQQTERLKTKVSNMTCAVGERNIYPTLHVVLDTIALGFRPAAIFLRKVSYDDLPLLQKIFIANPDTRIYFDTHPGMWNYIHHPQNYDISFGVPLLYLRNTPYTIDAPIHFPFIDYSTLEHFLNNLELLLDCKPQTCPVTNINTDNPDKRIWNIFRKE